MSLTTIMGPLIMNGTFAYFTSDKAPLHFPGMHFLLGAFCILLSLFIAARVLGGEKKAGPVAEAAPELAAGAGPGVAGMMEAPGEVLE
jgi:DHA1 family tetracycline resistance protein-like MFS transporter